MIRSDSCWAAVAADEVARVQAALLAVLGSGTLLGLAQVAKIPRDETGKLHFCRTLAR